MRSLILGLALSVSIPVGAQGLSDDIAGDIDENSLVAPELAIDPPGYETTIVVSWTKPSGPVSWYYVYRQRAGEDTRIATVSGLLNEYSVTGHVEGDTYQIQAVAVGPRSEVALPWCFLDRMVEIYA